MAEKTMSFDYSNFRTHPDDASTCTHSCGNYTGDSEKQTRLNADGTTRPHYGEDILAKPEDLILSPVDGVIFEIGKPVNNKEEGIEKGELKRVIIDFQDKDGKNTKSTFFYVKTEDYTELKKGDKVEVGTPLGVSQDLSPYYNKDTTPNHVHHQEKLGTDGRDPKKVFDYPQIQQDINEKYAPITNSYNDVQNVNNQKRPK